MYRFADCEKAAFPIVTMCRVLGVSPSGFWAWSKRPPSERARADAALTAEIRRIHVRSRGKYLGTHGYPNAEIRLFRTVEEYRGQATNWLIRRDGRGRARPRRQVSLSTQHDELGPSSSAP